MSELRDEIKQVFFDDEEPRDEEPDSPDPDRVEESDGEEGGEEQEETVESGEGEETGESAEAESADAEESLEERYNRLLEEYNSLNARLLELAPQPQMEKPAASFPQLAPRPPAQPPTLEISDDEISKAIVDGDVAAFKKILTQLASHAASVGEAYREQILQSVPTMAVEQAVQRVQLLSAVEAFFRDNPDLLPHRATAGAIINQIIAENPNISLRDAFIKTEAETRRRLGLKKRVLAGEGAKGKEGPAFVKKSGSRKPGAPEFVGVRAEIAEMQRAMRR